MKIDKSLAFRSEKLPVDNKKVATAYMMWIQSHQTVWKAFPKVHYSGYYKKLQLQGVQRFWTATWFDRFRTVGRLGDSNQEVNHCWASLILYHLDELWPQLDDISDEAFDQLQIINKLTNRTQGAKLLGLGLATRCMAPNRMEGFIDLYTDIAANEQLTQWVNKVFLPAPLKTKTIK